MIISIIFGIFIIALSGLQVFVWSKRKDKVLVALHSTIIVLQLVAILAQIL